MINLQQYKKETIDSLIKVYIKSCILKEYLSIFPIISKIDFTFNFLSKNWETKIKNTYIPLSLQSIGEYTVQDSIIRESISEIFQTINSLYQNQISIEKQFLSSIPRFDSEVKVGAINLLLNPEKYKDNLLYIEKYFRFETFDLPPITIYQSDEHKGVVNKIQAKVFLSQDIHTDEQFFQYIKDIKIGTRVMINPAVGDVDKQSLYNSLKNDPKIILEKINTIRGKFNSEEQYSYFFPLLICQNESSILNFTTRIKQNIINFIDSTLLQPSFESLIDNFWNNENFNKLFKYHIPIPSFEVLLPNEQLRINKLIKDVYDKNVPYNNFNKTIINLIESINKAEDPTRI